MFFLISSENAFMCTSSNALIHLWNDYIKKITLDLKDIAYEYLNIESSHFIWDTEWLL